MYTNLSSKAGVHVCVVWCKVRFIFSLFGALCHDAGYIELIDRISVQERRCKPRPHGKLTGLLSKTEQSGYFLSFTHTHCIDSHAGTPTHSRSLSCVRMISHTHTQSLAHSRFQEIVCHLRVCGSRYQYAGESRDCFINAWKFFVVTLSNVTQVLSVMFLVNMDKM